MRKSVSITEEEFVELLRNAALQERTTNHVDSLAVNTILSPSPIWLGIIDLLISHLLNP
jgi:hypothetical protein